MPELTIGGIALIPIIVALVEAAKRYAGVPSEYAPVLNGVLSVAGLLAMQYVGAHPEYEDEAVLVLQALILFLANAGLYETARFVRQSIVGEA